MGIHSSLPLVNNVIGVAAAEKGVGETDQKQVVPQPALPTESAGVDSLAEQRTAGNAAAKKLYQHARLKGQPQTMADTALHPEDEASLKEMERQLMQLHLPVNLASRALEGLKLFNVKTAEELKDRLITAATWPVGHPQKELAMNIIQGCEPLEAMMRKEQHAFKGREMVHPGLMMSSSLLSASA